MSENYKLKNHGETDRDESQPSRDRYRIWIWTLVVANALALIGIWCIAAQTTDGNSWANVIAVCLLGLASFDVATISALTSREMIETMKHQEIEMSLQRKTAQDQWKAMQDGLTETRILIGQNEQIVGASLRQAQTAEKSLKLSEDMFYIAERAYLTVVQVIHDNAPFEIGEKPVLSLVIDNGGNTPATDITLGVFTTFTDETISELTDPSKILDWGISNPVVDDIVGKGRRNLAITGDPVSDEEMDIWENEGKYFLGLKLDYSDIGKRPRNLLIWLELSRDLGCFVGATPDADS